MRWFPKLIAANALLLFMPLCATGVAQEAHIGNLVGSEIGRAHV